MLSNISNRLKLIASYAETNDTVADIGTDHGYVPIWLIQNNACRNVILSDINSGPLEKAKENIREHLGDVETDIRQGSGLSVLRPGEADMIVIAGMGGILTSKIIEADMDVALSAKKLVLQPRRDAALLRKYICNSNHFIIVEEQVVRENRKLCEILVVKPSSDNNVHQDEAEVELRNAAAGRGLSDSFLFEFPPLWLRGQGDASALVEYRLRGANTIRKSIIRNGNAPDSEERLREIESRIADISKFLELINIYAV
ncbi:MAG: class I SAM-dependent methyltransferase [Clostridia bacterium]|nr:class I SAM-dependent methyltransferase [Clostridia bacterium]